MSNLEHFEVFAAPDMIPVGAVCKRSTLISIATSIALLNLLLILVHHTENYQEIRKDT